VIKKNFGGNPVCYYFNIRTTDTAGSCMGSSPYLISFVDTSTANDSATKFYLNPVAPNGASMSLSQRQLAAINLSATFPQTGAGPLC
jgi:hypothetical protein